MSPPAEMNQANQQDDLLDRALRESAVGRLVAAAAAALSPAWTASASRSYASAASAGWRSVAAPARIRMIALAGAVAAVVHLAMSRLGQAEPLGAVVPCLVIVACALAALLAGPIARASERPER